MVRPDPKSRSIENHWTPDGLLRRLELANDLSEANGGIFLFEHIREIDLGGF